MSKQRSLLEFAARRFRLAGSALLELNDPFFAQLDTLRAKLAAQGTEPAGGSIAEVGRFVQTEKVKWEPIIRASGAKSGS